MKAQIYVNAIKHGCCSARAATAICINSDNAQILTNSLNLLPKNKPLSPHLYPRQLTFSQQIVNSSKRQTKLIGNLFGSNVFVVCIKVHIINPFIFSGDDTRLNVLSQFIAIYRILTKNNYILYTWYTCLCPVFTAIYGHTGHFCLCWKAWQKWCFSMQKARILS